MKILFILKRLERSGGALQYVQIANWLSENHEVRLIYFLNQDIVSEINPSIKTYQFALSLYSVPKIQQIIKNFQPQVIHTHTTHADFLGLIAAKSFPSIHTFSSMLLTKFRDNFLDLFYHKMYAWLYLSQSPNTKIIANSVAVKNMLIEKIKIPENRISLLYNAFDYTFQPKISLSHLPKDKIKILFVGRNTQAKNIPLLIEAISLLSEEIKQKIAVILVGNNTDNSSIQSLVKKCGVENIFHLEGETNSVNSYYEQADILVLPSLFESFGMVILEAFHHKLAVIASNIDGPAEIISHEKNGILFENKQANSLAKSIERLVLNKDFQTQLSEAGKQSLSQYTKARFLEQLLYLYHDDNYI